MNAKFEKDKDFYITREDIFWDFYNELERNNANVNKVEIGILRMWFAELLLPVLDKTYKAVIKTAAKAILEECKKRGQVIE